MKKTKRMPILFLLREGQLYAVSNDVYAFLLERGQTELAAEYLQRSDQARKLLEAQRDSFAYTASWNKVLEVPKPPESVFERGAKLLRRIRNNK